MNRAIPTNAIPIALIAALAFLLRAVQAHSGLPYIHNWDEPQIASHAIAMLKSGDLNPHFFCYGSLLIYIDFVVDAFNYLRLAGQPLSNPESMITFDQLSAIEVIKAPTDMALGWYWSISHPSFYLWDRYVTTVFGTLTVVVTYFVARKVIPGYWALLSPLLLAVLPIHIEHSAYVTTDAPVGLWVAAATLAAMTFAESGRLQPFLASLVFVGLAGATKYNSALIIALPALALAARSLADEKRPKWWHWALLAAVPAAIFLAVMPFALLDFKTFITDVADDISSYQAQGPIEAKPGLRHVRLVLSQFADNLSYPVSAVVVLGLVSSLRFVRRDWRPAFLLVFPILFIAYMAKTRADHHRNFVQLYPFLAIFFGLGALALARICAWLAPRLRLNRPRDPGLALASAILLAILAPVFVHTTRTAFATMRGVETRTTAVNLANRMDDGHDLLVAGELHLHPFDLASLKAKHVEVLLDDLVAKLCSGDAANHDFMLPVAIQYTGFRPQTPAQGVVFSRINRLLASLRGRGGVQNVGGDTPTPSLAPAIDPGVLVIQGQTGLCDGAALESAR